MEQIIGYTTGVFDMFHVGHLNILKKAKENCDRLIVGVSTDELCMEYKAKQPVIPFEERAEIVRSIKYVDLVVPQTTMNKMAAWETYQFNVVFVGDDWKGTEKWNRIEADFAEVGVKVIYMSYTKGVSSTSLRKRIFQLEGAAK